MKRDMKIALLIFSATFHIAFSTTQNGQIPNGDFEQGPKSSQMKGTKVIDPHAIPNWQISGHVEYIKSTQKEGDMLLVVPGGASAVRLGNDAAIKTTVKVAKGRFYSISFSASRTCAQEQKLKVSISPNSDKKRTGICPIQTVYSCDGWDSYSWGFVAESDRVEITIRNPGVEKDAACGPLIDSVALKALPKASRQRGNLMNNGNFEEGPYIFPNSTWGVLIPPSSENEHSPLPGWMIESLKAVKYIDSGNFRVPYGKRAVELVAGRESALAQIVKTSPGKTYDLIFLIGDANNSCEGSMVVEAAACRDVVQVPYESKGKGGFKRGKLRFKADSDQTRVRFLSGYYHMKSDNSGSLCGPVIDDIRVVRVRYPGRG